ncbi:MAG: thioredoxin family protein [Saprospiraceae bacterium]|nr:thioredoxin family protein [Saprospiraceae bacterium]
MALTDSSMLPLGTIAPSFSLLDVVSNETKLLKDLKSDKATLIAFICNHCPFVIHINPELIRIAEEYIPQGISIIAINSNDVVKYPQDGPDKMKAFAHHFSFNFPYLYDESQVVAKKYQAECTPDFYLFDGNLSLVYRGRLDESRPTNGKPLNGFDLRNALEAILGEKPVSPTQYPSAGCNIKWKG